MKRFTTTALITIAMLAGCSAAPDKIQATAAPKGAYAGLTCAAASREHRTETAKLAELSQRQVAARQTQGGAVVLLGVVGVLMTQNLDNAPEIAATKGRLAALDARLSGC